MRAQALRTALRVSALGLLGAVVREGAGSGSMLLTAAFAAPGGPVALAGTADKGSGASTAPTALERYLDGLTTLRADFTQRVTDAAGKPAGAGSGSLLVQRPDRFRWDYRPAGEGAAADDEQGQLLIADGRNVWFFDRELSQVTVKPIDAALSSTPIMLLSGSAADLRTHFEITAQPPQAGLQWVQVRPHSADADFSEARLGFHDGELVRMLVHNRLGQTVQLDFTHSRRNAPVDPAQCRFTAPPGVDVIGTPLPLTGPPDADSGAGGGKPAGSNAAPAGGKP